MPDVVIRPTCGRLLLQIIEPDPKKGGLLIVQTKTRGDFRSAWVKALPDGYRGSLNVGDRVMVPPYPDREVKINGETLVFIKEEQLPAQLEV